MKKYHFGRSGSTVASLLATLNQGTGVRIRETTKSSSNEAERKGKIKRDKMGKLV